jgi:predicted porin
MKAALRRHLAMGTTLALTSLAVHAQGAPSIYGLVDLSIGSTKAPGGTSSTSLDSGKMTTSFIGLSASEDLGEGLSATARFESFLRANTGGLGRFDGDPAFSRTASVSLSSKDLGTLSLGRNTTALFVSTLLFNAFGDSFGYSPSIRHYFTSGTVTGDTGWSDSFAYSSPSLSGVRFGVAGATKTNGTDEGDGSNWSLNLGYGSGPLTSSIVVQRVTKNGASPVDDTRTAQIGGAYDFGAAKIFAQYGEVENLTTSAKYKISGLGARLPVGTSALVAQWGHLNVSESEDRNTLSVGVLHNLSKRTELYAVAMHDKVEGISSGAGYSVGIRHRY